MLAQALDKDPAKRPDSATAIIERAERALGAPVRRRRGPRRAAAAAVAAAAACGAIALATTGDEVASDRSPAPSLAPGARAIGSALAPGDVRSVDCRGRRPTRNSPDCTVLQTRLPDRPLSVTRAGAIRRWTVRGAGGELALQVLHALRGRYRQVTRSQFENVRDRGVHTFTTDLPIKPGELVGLEVAPGASIGVREDRRGATTARWFDPVRVGHRGPTFGPGSGFDSELLLRVDYQPGARPRLPAAVTGRPAVAAPRGRVLGSEYVEVAGGRLRRTVAVRLPGRVALDLFGGDRRLARIGVPGADPRGQLLLLRVEFPLVDPGPELTWRNPSGRIVVHQYQVRPRSLRLIY